MAGNATKLSRNSRRKHFRWPGHDGPPPAGTTGLALMADTRRPGATGGQGQTGTTGQHHGLGVSAGTAVTDGDSGRDRRLKEG